MESPVTPVTPSVWGAFCLVEPRVSCPECSAFVYSVMGIRGPYLEGRKLRRSYRTGVARDGAVNVSGEFFDLLRDECTLWLNHLHDQNDLREHTGKLPAWIARLPCSVELRTDPQDGARYFAQRPDGDAATRVAAELLGISVRSVYRGVESGSSSERLGPR